MKTALFATALLMSGGALAQTGTSTVTQPNPATSPVAMPDNSAPRIDSMGVPVISAPATVPAGFNQAPGMNGVGGPYIDPSQPPTPQPATIDYPLCSRTITDHCLENYELGAAGPHHRHHRPH